MAKGTQKPISISEYDRLLEPLLGRSAAYARSLLRNRADAEDAVQQAALRGLENLSAYDSSRPFKAWWYAILRHCCIDVMRARGLSTATVETVPSPSAKHSPHEDWEELSFALGKIAAEHSEILRLRYFGNLSYRELARALDIPEGTVMSRLHYARKALAARMMED